MQFENVKHGKVLVLAPRAEALDADNVAEFRESMASSLDGAKDAVLDLGSLQFIDSSGLGAILSFLRQLNAAQGDLKLCGLSRPVRAVFELVRMHRIFEIYGDSDEALRSFA